MAKSESTLKNMLLSLTLISFCASALLAGGYVLTKEPIEKALQEKKNAAIKEVLPKGDIEIGKAVEVRLDGYEDAFVVYPAKKGGNFIGCAIETYDNNGYGGKVRSMVGFDVEGRVINYSVLEANETPGLGAKVSDWFKTKGDIRGKDPASEDFKVKKDRGEIDAITAATITSRAFLSSVKSAYQAFIRHKEQQKE